MAAADGFAADELEEDAERREEGGGHGGHGYGGRWEMDEDGRLRHRVDIVRRADNLGCAASQRVG